MTKDLGWGLESNYWFLVFLKSVAHRPLLRTFLVGWVAPSVNYRNRIISYLFVAIDVDGILHSTKAVTALNPTDLRESYRRRHCVWM